MNRLNRSAVSLAVVSFSIVAPGKLAVAQSQTPGQITQFDPNLNVVDSVITQDPNGNIGIGTTAPAAALDVSSGDLNLAGNLLKAGNLFLHVSGVQNTFLGVRAGNPATSGFFGRNTGIGYEALQYNTTGYLNTAVGDEALEKNTTGWANTASGEFALLNNTIGVGNTATGVQTLYANTEGNYNVATGINSLVSNTTGSFNTAVGLAALVRNTTGNGNTAIGNDALLNTTSGGTNTAIGNAADVAQGDLFNATAIGAYAMVDASNKIRLGNTLVSVIEGPVPYTFTSDRNQKENFQPVDGEQVLRKLGDVNVTSWNYLGHDPQQFRHYGPVAQEFFAAFGHDAVGTIGTPKTINSGDLEGILMIAVQALDKQNRELKARIEALERLVKGTAHGVQ